MKTHFYNLDSWQDCNDKIRQQWNFKNSEELHIFPGIHQALMETLLGLSKQFVVKRKLYYLKEVESLIKTQLNYLAIEGFDLVAITLDQLESEDWFIEVDHKTLAILLPDDIPLIAQKIEIKNLLSKTLDKKIFCIHFSFFQHFFAELSEDVHPYEVHLMSFNKSLSVGRFGERAQIASYFSKNLFWDWEQLKEPLQLLRITENPERVKSFESKSVAGSQPLFLENKRFFDRALVYWPDIDASALRELVLEKLNLPLDSSDILTSSLIYWGGLKTMNWLKEFGLSLEQIRGLLIISERILTKELEQALVQSYFELIELQNGSIKK